MPAATAFFERTYDEALDLVVEAQTYLRDSEPRERVGLPAVDCLRLACEALRMTARLTQIMAWLLAQRAVHAGEITQGEALADPQPLADLHICMAEPQPGEGAGLPASLVDLAGRSRKLYVRIARLDELARRRSA